MLSTHTQSLLKRSTLALGAIIILSTLGAAPAFAKACKNVHIEVKNTSGQEIKIIDLDYWDSESEKWRSEPVSNQVIKNNRTWQIQRNLERVNGQPVKLRVEYRERKWNKLLKKWVWTARKGKKHSTSKQCKRNSEYMISIR